MTTSELFETIRRETLRVLGDDLDPARVTLQSRLREDLEMGSLQAVDLVMALEDTYGIEIEDGEIREVSTLQDVVSVVESKLAHAGG